MLLSLSYGAVQCSAVQCSPVQSSPDSCIYLLQYFVVDPEFGPNMISIQEDHDLFIFLDKCGMPGSEEVIWCVLLSFQNN
jgi:hypothetical protein